MDSGFQVLDIKFFASETWIPESNRQRDSILLELDSVPGSRKAPDFGFFKQNFLGFWNPDHFTFNLTNGDNKETLWFAILKFLSDRKYKKKTCRETFPSKMRCI